MGDFTSEKEQKLLESEAEVSNTEDTNADELTFEETSGFSDDAVSYTHLTLPTT